MSPLARIERFFAGWRFPVLALSVLGLFALLIGALGFLAEVTRSNRQR